jgi:predicted dehydrogenase
MPITHPPLRWGILATGRIANNFATDLRASRTGVLQAVASRDLARAQAFAAKHHTPTAHGDYESLLADPTVDAVYIATPHPDHCEWAVRAAESGKPILCEKPLAMNLAEATRIVEAARANQVFLMEAFMVRCHPQTHRIVDLIRSGTLGTLQFIEASLGFRSKYDPTSRLWNRTLGGGGILDVGCYPAAMTRLLAGAAANQPFANPTHIAAAATLHPEANVDTHAAATLTFPGGLIAQIACAIDVQLPSNLTLHGTAARLHVPIPWIIPSQSTLELTPFDTNKTESIKITTDLPPYALEADTVAEAIRAGKLESPAMPPADSLGNAALLDHWLATSRNGDFRSPTQSRKGAASS